MYTGIGLTVSKTDIQEWNKGQGRIEGASNQELKEPITMNCKENQGMPSYLIDIETDDADNATISTDFDIKMKHEFDYITMAIAGGAGLVAGLAIMYLVK